MLYRRRANNSLYRLFAPVMLLFAAIAASAASAAEVTFPFNLPEQALADTLKAIARQTATSIVFAPETAEHITAPAIRGTYTTEQAVTKALFGTTLRFQKPAPNSILIEPSERSSPGAPAADSSGAQAASSPATRSAPADMNSAYRPILQEIVVTSTRREESLSKVPLSVVATNQETLDKQGVRAMDDLMRLTPGVTFGQTAQFYGTGQSAIAIRGIQSTSGIPTTGVYIDDTPVQARSGVSPSLTNPYPEIFDLDRVEVLRGPQGTLFGTGSVGGAVRFITPEPSLDRASMYARSEMASTDNGGMSYEAGLAGGAPIVTDKLGFRASVWHRSDGGYIDRLDRTTRQLAQRDINDGESDVARVAVSWKPIENLTITPSVFYQRTSADDGSLYEVATSEPSRNDFRSSLAVLPQAHWDRFYLPAVKASLDFAGMSLISNSSYFTRKTYTRSDDSTLSMALFAGHGGPFPEGFDDYVSGTISRTTQKGLTQELRLQKSDPNERLNWVVGVFYLESEVRDAFDAADPQLLSVINFGQSLAGLPPVTSVAELFGVDLYQGLYSVRQRVSYRDVERSLFAQADYELLAGLKLTAGLRYTAADFEYGNFIAGPLYATDGSSSNLESSSSPVTPKLGLSYEANDDNLFYANAAKGVRGSGVADALGERCAADAAAIGIDALTPRDVKPDTVWSYEIGSKNKLFDGRVGVDLAAYHVDWTDVQTTLVLPVCQLNTTFNLGSAEIDGVDLALSLQPLLGLSLGVAASYIDARYTTDLPGPDDIIIRRKGEPLDVAPWSVHLSGEYEFSLARYDAYARADYSYTSHNNTPLDLSSPLVDPSLPRAPKTTRLDIRAGMSFGDLDVSLFVENLLNDHPVLSLGHDSLDSENYRTTTYRPRTIGLTATYRK